MNKEEVEKKLKKLGSWHHEDYKKLVKTFAFPDYKKTIEFVNRVAAIAEYQKHHPGLHVFWGKVVVELSTHDANAITEKDFLLAAKIDALEK